jgi:hypothetical protein
MEFAPVKAKSANTGDAESGFCRAMPFMLNDARLVIVRLSLPIPSATMVWSPAMLASRVAVKVNEPLASANTLPRGLVED